MVFLQQVFSGIALGCIYALIALGYAFVMKLAENTVWSWAALAAFAAMVWLATVVVRELDRARERAGSGRALRLETVSGFVDILAGRQPAYLQRVADAINGTVQARRALLEKI